MVLPAKCFGGIWPLAVIGLCRDKRSPFDKWGRSDAMKYMNQSTREDL
jgi:hypothetical protein